MEEEKQSQFNMNNAILERISNLLQVAAEATNKKDLDCWYCALMTLNKEVTHLFKGIEGKINKNYRSHCTGLDNELNGYVTRDRLYMFPNFGRFYALLERWEGFLRKVLSDNGMLYVKKSGDGLSTG